MRLKSLIILCFRLSFVIGRNADNYHTSPGNEQISNFFKSLASLGDHLQPVRKCCQSNEYYSEITQRCEDEGGKFVFDTAVKKLILEEDLNLFTLHKRIEGCPETNNYPKNVIIQSTDTHKLFKDGSILDSYQNKLYNLTHYCLEMVGAAADSSILVFAFCPEHENVTPKCCPDEHYFDTRINDCSPYYFVNGTEGDATLMPHLPEGTTLRHQELYCRDISVKVGLDEVTFMNNNLCLENLQECYMTDKYCVENILNMTDNALRLSAFVCPDYFINKCCPDGQSLHSRGCTVSEKRSISMIHMTRNHRYHIKTASSNSECSPLTIEDETRSDISWEINTHALAEITKNNKTIQTRNYCIDDFVTENDVFPVIKVCSEEIEEYHEVSSIDDWKDVIGKCCPSGMVYHPNMSTDGKHNALCIDDNTIADIRKYDIEEFDMPKLVYSNFPVCRFKDKYHDFQLHDKSRDFAELTSDNMLRVVTTENGCTRKEALVTSTDFCMDFIAVGKRLKLVAIICAPSIENPHFERNPVIVTLLSISCGALLLTFFSLVFMRVRRGMVTMKKINTLAGRILTSYVVTQLLSFLCLCVGVLADFGEDVYKCFILGGFMLLFSLSSFCWNTSICLEGFLLTMHVKLSEKRRFACHCLWAWGIPSIITAVAVIKDAHREKLRCDAITPKFGVERCFFSDPIAQIYYFYLPISLTVIMNTAFLVAAKVIRRTKLRELERDPNRIKRHGTLKKVFSIKNRKSLKQKEGNLQPSTHSGLRTHQFQNTWIESTKLVLWSGGTWITEIIAILIIWNEGGSQGEWYHYLWYIPVGFNCLRGLGIFIIIVLTADNKTKIMRTVRNFSSTMSGNVSKLKSTFSSHHARAYSRKSVITEKNDAFQKPLDENLNANNERKVSISTVLTYLSPTRQCSLSDGMNQAIPGYCHSVSREYFRTNSCASGLSDVFENIECERKQIDLSENEHTWNINFGDMEHCTHL